MASLDQLRALLQARYDIDPALPADRPALQERFDELVEAVLFGTSISRNTLLEAISHRYRAFRAAQRSPEQRR